MTYLITHSKKGNFLIRMRKYYTTLRKYRKHNHFTSIEHCIMEMCRNSLSNFFPSFFDSGLYSVLLGIDTSLLVVHLVVDDSTIWNERHHHLVHIILLRFVTNDHALNIGLRVRDAAWWP